MSTTTEQKKVHHALRQMGFVGLSPFDWIHRVEGVVCAIPHEETKTFEDAIRFLREGAFQNTLQKKTKLAYYKLSQDLFAWCQSFSKKGFHGKPEQPFKIPTTA